MDEVQPKFRGFAMNEQRTKDERCWSGYLPNQEGPEMIFMICDRQREKGN